MRQLLWKRSSLLRLVVIFSLLLVFVAGAVPASAKAPPTKNIILLIADGSGFNTNDITSMYEYGRTGVQSYERFPYKMAMSTYSADGHGYDPVLAWQGLDYIKTGYTDSAAAATAMATGVKTYDAGIGVDKNGNRLENIVEKAERQGKATGVVTSVAFSHATPAGFVAHNANRSNYGAIAKEMVRDSAVDVVMGAGNPWYNHDGGKRSSARYRYIDQAEWDALVVGTAGGDANGDGIVDPWVLVQDAAEFRSLQTGPTPDRVFGVAQVQFTLQEERYLPWPTDPFELFQSPPDWSAPHVVPYIPDKPTLAEMTRGALNVLDNDPDGFFLMVEGGAVDYAAHYWRPGRIIEERIAFNEAIEAVLDWVKQNSNWGETLVVVTSDHETGLLCGPGSDPVCQPPVNNGKGQMPSFGFYSSATIEKYDDGRMYDYYVNHTNALVPLWAKGDAGRFLWAMADQQDPVRGRYIDNTELAKALFQALGE